MGKDSTKNLVGYGSIEPDTNLSYIEVENRLCNNLCMRSLMQIAIVE